MDTEKMIRQHDTLRNKKMSELIADKHKKNQEGLDSLHKKWMPESQSNKKTP